jgi:hypothetical protein
MYLFEFDSVSSFIVVWSKGFTIIMKNITAELEIFSYESDITLIPC